MKYNVIIVDDEPLAQDVLESYIEKIPNLELVKRCSNAVEALEALNEGPTVDIIFLDIQMPEITGLDFMKSLKRKPAIIFTTAYSEYALEGFENDAIDYLLKPIAFDRFLKAVNKATHYISLEKKAQPQAAEGGQPDETGGFIFVKSDKKIVKIRLNDILYIEGLKDYVMIYTTEGRIITLQTMKNLEEGLPANQFLRVHRSYIVSVDKIKAIVGNSVEIGDKQLPVGKHYKEQLLELVEKHNMIK